MNEMDLERKTLRNIIYRKHRCDRNISNLFRPLFLVILHRSSGLTASWCRATAFFRRDPGRRPSALLYPRQQEAPVPALGCPCVQRPPIEVTGTRGRGLFFADRNIKKEVMEQIEKLNCNK